MTMLTRLLLASLIPAAIAVAATAGSASAQYPPPVGNCVVVASATAVDVGDDVAITVTVRDLFGDPVAGEPVTLTVSQSGASVSPPSASTDGNGVVNATLDVGGTPGVVEVTATTAEVACRASVGIAGGEVAGEIDLPNTGTGTSATSKLPEIVIALVIGGGILAVAGASRRRA
jgi:hypothetical protein